MPFFETNDHTNLYYRDWGTGIPVVFVSAWALSGAMWEYQMLPLSEQGLRCIDTISGQGLRRTSVSAWIAEEWISRADE